MGRSLLFQEVLPAKARRGKARKSPQKVGLFSDVTLDEQLGTDSKGKNWIPLFSSTAYSQDGRQITNRWVGMEGFLEEVVSGLEVEIRRPGVQGMALRKNRNFLHRTGERCRYTCPLG